MSVIPAVGFDVVPSDCLAAMLAERLPGATLLQLAFTGPRRLSQGTINTMLEGLGAGGRARIGGCITKVPVAWKSMEVPFRNGPQHAMTVPWGDVATAWYTTGIANIETYVAMPERQIRQIRRFRGLLPLLGLRPLRPLLRAGISRFAQGVASAGGLSGQAEGSSFWGRVRDHEGRHVEATLETVEGYRLTVLTALASIEKVLAGAARPGFLTPAKAFGADFILTIPQAEASVAFV